METAIELNSISKAIGKNLILDNVSLRIPTGAIFGIIGPNGIGKSTILKIMARHWLPSSGTLNLASHRVGFASDSSAAYPDLSIIQNFKIFGQSFGVDQSEKVEELISLLRLEEFRHKKVKHLSLGNKQRFNLALSMLGDPPIIVIDEPTNGLDPIGIQRIREIILSMNKNGKTIVLISHALNELEKIYSHVAFLKDAKIVREVQRNSIEEDSSLEDIYFQIYA